MHKLGYTVEDLRCLVEIAARTWVGSITGAPEEGRDARRAEALGRLGVQYAVAGQWDEANEAIASAEALEMGWSDKKPVWTRARKLVQRLTPKCQRTDAEKLEAMTAARRKVLCAVV